MRSRCCELYFLSARLRFLSNPSLWALNISCSLRLFLLSPLHAKYARSLSLTAVHYDFKSSFQYGLYDRLRLDVLNSYRWSRHAQWQLISAAIQRKDLPKKLVLNQENKEDNRATFLDLEAHVKDGKFILRPLTNGKHLISMLSTILISPRTYLNDQLMASTSPKLYVMLRYVF